MRFGVRYLTFGFRRSTFDWPIALLLILFVGGGRADEPFFLGHRAADDLPPLTETETGTAQQRALLAALGGDAYGHRGGEHECRGCSMLIRRHAIPSNTTHYGGYQLGGGVPIHGEGPTLEEGTFGWDYFGILFNKRIVLNWTHGRRYQGGIGTYKTDGPRHQRR